MWDINVKIAELKEKIEMKINHPYLGKYIPTPVIDEDKIILFYTLLTELHVSESKLDNYLITIMLVQIALDTHETVTIEDVNGLKMKNRQLTVLAGDYYSGLYYYLLAGINDIPMVKVLAEGIKDVNEYKIKLYQREIDQIEMLFNTLNMIESSIFRRISAFIQKPLLTELAPCILLLKRLIHERDLYIQNGNSIVFDILNRLLLQQKGSLELKINNEQETSLLLVWDRYINQTKDSIQQLLKNNSPCNHVLHKRIHDLLYDNISANRHAEEG